MTPSHVGPRRHPVWLDTIAQVVMFALGVLAILYPIITRTSHTVAFLVTGMVLLGIFRLADVLAPLIRRKDNP